MLAAFDFGISNTDVAIFSENSVKYFTVPSSKEKITTNLIEKILFDLELPITKVEVLGVTGGKSSDLEQALGRVLEKTTDLLFSPKFKQHKKVDTFFIFEFSFILSTR